MNFRLIALLIVVFSSIGAAPGLLAQGIPPGAFGNITPGDFTFSSPLIDSGTAAVVLADAGSASLEGYEERFRMVFTRHTRIRILTKNGYDAAKVKIRYSDNDNEARILKSLQAVTYNLEDGKVVQTPLSEKDIYVEKPDPDLLEETFTFPNVKEGSIIDWSYTVNSSSYFRLRPWLFQGKYPVLWSEYKITMPDVFNYVCLLQGHHDLFGKTYETGKEAVTPLPGWGKSFLVKAGWTMKDVPALKEEPFTTTLDNHIAGIRFQLSVRPIGPGRSETVLGTWEVANNRLLYSEDFGVPIAVANHWLKSDLKRITAGCTNDTAKARRIFAYVRDNFTATGYGVFLTDNVTLKELFKKRTGSIADINLLLIAMLREANIMANPVILSTRDNGLTDATYPLMDKYNYVVCIVTIGNTVYYLDASRAKTGFGHLPLECYNGHARVICEGPYAVYLAPDSLHEFKTTTVYLYNDEKDGMAGYYSSTPGYFESLQLRTQLENTKQADYFKTVRSAYPYPVELDSTGIDSLSDYDAPATIHYVMRFNPGDNDIIYFNPMLSMGIKENPFKSLKREYPVEMPYASDQVYVLNMEIPKGYKIDELPKSVKIELDKHDGLFEYGIVVSENTVQLRVRVLLKKAIFESENYTSLRDFYGYVVKKENEFIVFRKTAASH